MLSVAEHGYDTILLSAHMMQRAMELLLPGLLTCETQPLVIDFQDPITRQHGSGALGPAWLLM